MQFNCRVEAAQFDEARDLWRLKIGDGRELTCRFVVLAIGLLSTPTLPRLQGMDDFKGRSFHTYLLAARAGRDGRQEGRRDRHRRHRDPDHRRDRRQGRRAHRVPAPAELGGAAQQRPDLRRGDGRHPRAATTRSSRPARARPAASSTSPTGAASTRSRARSGWSCGTSSTASPASASGSPISARSSPTRRRTPSSPSTSPIASASGSRIPKVAEKLIPQRPRLRRAARADGDALFRGL